MGDPTSHGGKVLEGSQTDLCMGKPIAFIGHKTTCPKCKGTYPIVEGVLTTTLYGKGVAVAGMKTACGAVLIATQFTDTVEWSSGASGKATSAVAAQSVGATAALAGASVALATEKAADADDGEADEIEHFYTLVDGNGKPLEGYHYDLHIDDKLHTKAGAYSEGATIKFDGEGQTRLVTWLNQDGGLRG